MVHAVVARIEVDEPNGDVRAFLTDLGPDPAEVARRLGLTRARVTQLLDLTLLAPDIQRQLLEIESLDGVEPLHERAVRHLLRSSVWVEQREVWRAITVANP